MIHYLSGKRIVLGVTGSIAAYKSVDLVRRLVEAGATVRVVMSASAKAFITPLTFQAVSGNPVHDDLFDLAAEAAMGHIELARWADLVVVAPASADFLAKCVTGQANDLLSTLCLVTRAPIALAPAMNQAMWLHDITQANATALAARGVHLLGPGAGSQACGEVGPGRMLEPLDLLARIANLFSNQALAGVKVVITAGPTQEPIDPVRYLSNGSSGKMGYALAAAAREAGASVTLISGPTALPAPAGVAFIGVRTALDMYEEVMKKAPGCDIFLSVAAVADYRCEQPSDQKIHKSDASLTLSLVRNPDIVASVAALPTRPMVVGFAAETHDMLASAKQKLVAKRLDMIIANHVGGELGIGSDDNAVTVITHTAETPLARAPKGPLAQALIALIASQWKDLHSQDKVSCL